MNEVCCIGRIVRDLELKELQNDGAVLHNAIAIPSHYAGKKRTDFINFTCWNGLAKTMAKYLSKGDEIGLVGTLHSSSYENDKGDTIYTVEIIAQDVTFLRKKQSEVQPVDVDINKEYAIRKGTGCNPVPFCF